MVAIASRHASSLPSGPNHAEGGPGAASSGETRSERSARLRARATIEIRAPVSRVHALWTRYEAFPQLTDSVRRTQRIDDRNVLWDVDIAGRQLVWVARIVEDIAGRLVRWESRWGARHRGEVRFEALPGDATRLTVEILYEPSGWIERLGARIGLVDAHLRRDLDRFRRHAERAEEDPAGEDGLPTGSSDRGSSDRGSSDREARVGGRLPRSGSAAPGAGPAGGWDPTAARKPR